MKTPLEDILWVKQNTIWSRKNMDMKPLSYGTASRTPVGQCFVDDLDVLVRQNRGAGPSGTGPRLIHPFVNVTGSSRLSPPPASAI
jgi:hypothetical protein